MEPLGRWSNGVAFRSSALENDQGKNPVKPSPSINGRLDFLSLGRPIITSLGFTGFQLVLTGFLLSFPAKAITIHPWPSRFRIRRPTYSMSMMTSLGFNGFY